MKYEVIKSTLKGNENRLRLKWTDGTDDTTYSEISIVRLLASDFFKTNNPERIPVFEKALEYIHNDETGIITLNK